MANAKEESESPESSSETVPTNINQSIFPTCPCLIQMTIPYHNFVNILRKRKEQK